MICCAFVHRALTRQKRIVTRPMPIYCNPAPRPIGYEYNMPGERGSQQVRCSRRAVLPELWRRQRAQTAALRP